MSSTLAEELGVADATEDDLYEAMDWLLERQARIEKKLAARDLSDGTQVLYDVTSSYYEGRTCPLMKFGHDRDGKLFASMAQIRLVNVPCKGSAPGIMDLVGGRIAATARGGLPLILPHVRSGRVRALGVSSAIRAAALPDIPTIAEGGLPGYEVVQWNGLLAPAGTPREIIARLYQKVTPILRSPEMRERLGKEGIEVVASSPDEFAAFFKAEVVKWARVVKAAGIQSE